MTRTQRPGSEQRLTPLQAYTLAERQKQARADTFLHELGGIYHQYKNGSAVSSAESTTVALFCEAVDQSLRARGDMPLNKAVGSAYRQVCMPSGLQRIDPASPSFEQDLLTFHRNYLVNFPIPSEQESLEGFRELLSAGAAANGYLEVAYNVICPLTTRYIMGLNFVMQPACNSVQFIYGFVMPWARASLGCSRFMLEAMRSIVKQHAVLHGFDGDSEPLITFEKNRLGSMMLGDILKDSAGVDIEQPPGGDADLSLCAIGQSLRDLVWDRLGGRIININYMQPSLDGVTKVTNKNDEQLVVRYLNGDPLLTEEQIDSAEAVLAAALGDKSEGSRILDLCMFVSPDTTTVDSARLVQSLEGFLGISVVKDPHGIRDDIYYKAMMVDVAKNSRDGRIDLRPIKPFGIDGVENFLDAEQVTRILLRHVNWEALQANSDHSYADWLREKYQLIAKDFTDYKNAHDRL